MFPSWWTLIFVVIKSALSLSGCFFKGYHQPGESFIYWATVTSFSCKANVKTTNASNTWIDGVVYASVAGVWVKCLSCQGDLNSDHDVVSRPKQ